MCKSYGLSVPLDIGQNSNVGAAPHRLYKFHGWMQCGTEPSKKTRKTWRVSGRDLENERHDDLAEASLR